MNLEILDRTIGNEGADGTNKSRFAIIEALALASVDVKNWVMLVRLPEIGTVSGQLLQTAERYGGFDNCTMATLYAANRLEMANKVRPWLDYSSDHWVVHDRTNYSGKAYAMARGVQDLEWLDGIDAKFYEMQAGFYLERPLEESRQIMKRRGNIALTPEQEKVDSDTDLQARVRFNFAQIFSSKPNWTTIDVSGIANSQAEFYNWELRVGVKIWETLCHKIGRDEWCTNAEGLITDVLSRRDLGIFQRVIPWSHTDLDLRKDFTW